MAAPDVVNQLVGTLKNNCEAAEQLALETVSSCDMPFLSCLRDLSKGECWHILRKHQVVFNKVEQALLLSGLTDFVLCASQNELFDTFRKKSDRDGLPALLSHLNSKWVRFFNRLGKYDLTYAQLKSVVSLLKHSLKKLPESYQNFYLAGALVLGECSLEKASQDSVPDKATHWTPLQERETSQKDALAAKKPSPVFQHPVPTVDLTDPPERAPAKKVHKKYNADITKYILKSRENKETTRVLGTGNGTLSTGKENKDVLLSGSTGCDLENLTHETHKEKHSLAVDADSPSKKKPCIEGTKRVNAFALMMKHSRVKKGEVSKKKVLFP
ncbi:uncharacterized protein [Periplaneta americana]